MALQYSNLIISLLSASIIGGIGKKGTPLLLDSFKYVPVLPSTIFFYQYVTSSWLSRAVQIEQMILLVLLLLYQQSLLTIAMALIMFHLIMIAGLCLQYLYFWFKKLRIIKYVITLTFLCFALIVQFYILYFSDQSLLPLSYSSAFCSLLAIISALGLVSHKMVISHILSEKNYHFVPISQQKINVFLKLASCLFIALPTRFRALLKISLIKALRNPDILLSYIYMLSFIILTSAFGYAFTKRSGIELSLTIALICTLILNSKLKFSGKLANLNNTYLFPVAPKAVSLISDITAGILLVFTWLLAMMLYFTLGLLNLADISYSFVALLCFLALNSLFIITGNLTTKQRNRSSFLFFLFVVPLNIFIEQIIHSWWPVLGACALAVLLAKYLDTFEMTKHVAYTRLKKHTIAMKKR
ncbi:hypothetical protein [Mesobacillus subterraneus]|uniref:Uncharacterized protein n=1 Tax=Mesobacillus subterraneus TaxID=285983 RepID=A0A3R9EEF1_9BACI|nr:hypothetical protein [Mesobacillus subterraneus]RSD28507.1 hypothetical protein EJA10_05345 [Mesobacillus subterraneus]